MVDSAKFTELITLDLSDNFLERNFPTLLKLLKDKCDFLTNLYASGNKAIKKSLNMQITRAKKASGAFGMPLL